MIYMTHPEHGAMHVYSESEARLAESRGWVRAEWPPKPKAMEPARKKPGPKPKAE